MKENNRSAKFWFLGLVLLITVNCSFGQAVASINTATPKATIKMTDTTAPKMTKTSTQMPKIVVSDKSLDLIGIWKSDDMHAPDNSWKISYSVYLKFANNKQFVYHGLDAFTSNQPTDEGDLVFIDESTFIKKIISITGHPEYLNKYQKWVWHISNNKITIEIYNAFDSQEQAQNDSIINTLATGVKVEQ
jgi:hypothetical protein